MSGTELLLPGKFDRAEDGSGFQRVLFEQVENGERPPTIVVTPSTKSVGVTRRDTHRPGFTRAVRAASREGFPVLVRGSGGGATAASEGTFGFSIVRPSTREEGRRGIAKRYAEASAFVLGAFTRLGVSGAEVGEVEDEFCPGDNSIRVGGWEGMKLVGIAQRVRSNATSVGGIVLVSGEAELARVLRKVYGVMDLPLRPESVGSLRRAGYEGPIEEVIEAFAEEAEERYGARRVEPDEETLRLGREAGVESLVPDL